jgi:UDP-N-acetyl-D-mannosaminuronate dehydrogenase
VNKDLVIGLGEIGKPILKVLSKSFPTTGFDLNPKLMNKNDYNRMRDYKTIIAHICIPYSNKFKAQVLNIINSHKPEIIVIHSTVSIGTTEKIQKKTKTPIIYSATRGIHKRMLNDLKRYTKFFSIEKSLSKSSWAARTYVRRLHKAGIKTKSMSSTKTLELAKIICDTSYYGWLINYAQLSNMIAVEHRVNFDEMWSFSDEIHKYLGNRPKMYPGFIGGHCVIPNLDLIHNKTLDLIKQINQTYSKKIKNAKKTSKKHQTIKS